MKHGSLDENMMLMVDAADLFIKNPSRTSPFYAAPFLKAAKLVLTNLKELFTGHSLVDHSSSQLLMALKWQARQGL